MELVVYAVVFGAVLQAPSDDAPYPLFVYVGIVMWTFVSGSLTRTTTSITAHSGLVKSVVFPRAAAPLAAVGAALFDALLSAVLLAAALIYYDAPLSFHVVWIVPITVVLVGFMTGLGLILSALNVFYRDIHHLVGVGVRLWLFITPVVYASSSVPAGYRDMYDLNPLVGIFESVRVVLIQGRPPDWSALLYPTVVAGTLLLAGTGLFRRTEPYFAETV